MMKQWISRTGVEVMMSNEAHSIISNNMTRLAHESVPKPNATTLLSATAIQLLHMAQQQHQYHH